MQVATGISAMPLASTVPALATRFSKAHYNDHGSGSGDKDHHDDHGSGLSSGGEDHHNDHIIRLP